MDRAPELKAEQFLKSQFNTVQLWQSEMPMAPLPPLSLSPEQSVKLQSFIEVLMDKLNSTAPLYAAEQFMNLQLFMALSHDLSK